MKQLVSEGRHQEGSEDDDDDDDLDMGDTLSLECTKVLVMTMNGSLKASVPMKKTAVTTKVEKVGPMAHQKFAQLTSVSVGFLSADGGSKQWKKVDQHGSQITKLIKKQ